MTAASAYSTPSDQASTESRSSEPSMEDILASIRRIIADDQTQGAKPGYGNGARRGQAAAAASPFPASDRDARARTSYDDVLDLARMTPATGARSNGDAEQAASLSVDHAHDADDVTDGEAHRATGTAVTSSPNGFSEPARRAGDEAGDPDSGRSDHDEDDTLLSAPLGASVMSAFETLAGTVVLQNTPMLERVMRDLLRPMLKTWLDDNLPALVERLVRTEIERVARGSRG